MVFYEECFERCGFFLHSRGPAVSLELRAVRVFHADDVFLKQRRLLKLRTVEVQRVKNMRYKDKK